LAEVQRSQSVTSIIASQPRSRDFIDLYCILQKKAWTIDELLRYVRIKYDVSIDYAQLGKQILQVTVLKDYPKLLIPLTPPQWQKYFLGMPPLISFP
jgi:hypothetical protein